MPPHQLLLQTVASDGARQAVSSDGARGCDPRRGVLLVNLGTPDAPTTPALRRYLRQFLSDPRVVDIAAPLRWMLVNLVIVPWRAPKSAAAYRTIWQEGGSPLLLHSQALGAAVAAALGDGYQVELGMRYGNPSIRAAVDRLCDADLSDITVLPLFPQYASATTGSALECVMRELAGRMHIPPVNVCPPFFDRDDYIEALAATTRQALGTFRPDIYLLSYHGLPQRQVDATHAAGLQCSSAQPCPPLTAGNRHCYRAQCSEVSRRLSRALGLTPEQTVTCFQSRLKRVPWIGPYTDETLARLASDGVRRLAVLSPAFVVDCLETLEELGERGAAQWRALGGEALRLVPCLNADPGWVRVVADMVRQSRP